MPTILVEVTGDTATATANVVGVHRLTNPHDFPLWTVGGTCDLRFERGADGWRIHAIKQDITWFEGNQQVLFRAATRAA